MPAIDTMNHHANKHWLALSSPTLLLCYSHGITFLTIHRKRPFLQRARCPPEADDNGSLTNGKEVSTVT